MVSLFTSLDLYNYVMDKLKQPISLSLKLSLLFKSIQKDFLVDKYMVVIFLNYIRCLINLQSDDILLIFKTSKLKYFKYWCFWREYLSYIISVGEKIDKIIDEGIKFLNVKEFKDKQKILDFLLQIKEDKDRQKYIYNWTSEWMTIENIDESCNVKEESGLIIAKCAFENSKDVQFTDHLYSPAYKKSHKSFPNTPITDDVNKYSYKDGIIDCNKVIKCKIEDITLGEDTNLFKMGLKSLNNDKLEIKNYKEDNKVVEVDFKHENEQINKENLKNTNYRKNKEQEFFTLNGKKLLKINIIGKGGSSKVYKVFYESEFYALKVINIEMDSTLKNLLLEEIDLLKKLQSVDGIIKMIDYEILTDNIYILLEYGETVLNQFMKSDKKDIFLHSNRVKYIWQEILLIVLNIHDQRIIHGDLKPANFVFVKNKLKIIDFGISKALNSNTTRLDLDMVCGTLNYCAPELFFENRKRRSSDVWSLGIILYELWYGKTPLDAYKTYLEKKENIVNIRKNLKLTSKVDLVIYMCLNEDCRQRPTVKDLLKDKFICNSLD